MSDRPHPTPAASPGIHERVERSQRLAALGALVARLAHELGTPLHSIAGHLERVQEDERLPGDVRERVAVVGGEVQRLSRLIRRYLERLRAPEPAFGPVDLPELIRGVLRVLEPVLEARGITVDADLAPAADVPCEADHDQIEQAVLNLVQNAIDAMPEGGRLAVRLAGAEGACVISVGDTGTGIAPGIRDHVFDAFFTTKPGGRGTGLGLAICREIARAHGGDVLLDSQPGVGTVVTLVLGAPGGGGA